MDEHQKRHGMHVRVMRAGHSLIGGMYAESGDSIFGSFYIPEGEDNVSVRGVHCNHFTLLSHH